MIWQIPEPWEIIKVMEISGFWTLVSFIIWTVLFLPIPPIVRFHRNGYLKMNKGILFLLDSFRRASWCLMGGWALYFFMFFLLLLHPMVTIDVQ